MAPKVKEAMSCLSDAMEMAAGCALVVVAAYAILLVDLTGNGRLWDAARGLAFDSTAPAPLQNTAVVTRAVPVRPQGLEERAQSRMLVLPEVPDKEVKVAVLASEQPFRAEALTDALSDAQPGKDWRVHLNGGLRTFTVYGKGDERSSASASATASAAPAAAVVPAPTPAVAASAYRAGAASGARPGISDHVARISGVSGDGVRNFR
jgi:hypothetical protein